MVSNNPLPKIPQYLPDEPEIIFLRELSDGSLQIVNEDEATTAKIIYPDGRVIFAEPDETADLHYGPGPHASGSPQKAHGYRYRYRTGVGGKTVRIRITGGRSEGHKKTDAMLEKHRLGRELAAKANEFYQGVEIVYTHERRSFKVGDNDYNSAGSYNPETNTITLRPGAIDKYGRLKDATLFHELQHARWKKFQDMYYAEYAEIMELAEQSDSIADWPIDLQGELKPGYEGRWPAYELYQKSISSDERIAYWGTLNRVGDYSAAYWDAAEDNVDRILAINETLAEIAEAEQYGTTKGIPDEWMQLFREIKDVTQVG
jgi:hypothetical protein